MNKPSLNRKNVSCNEPKPIKIVQFGEGNFLRAFVGYAISELNKFTNFNAGIAVVQPIDKGLIPVLNEQDGLYTLFMRGLKNGKAVNEVELIDTIVKGINPYSDFNDFLELGRTETLEFVISNTTEAGISFISSDTQDMRPPSSFPAKLTLFLLERYNWYKGDVSKGLTVIPCELINYNADTLKAVILKYVDLWNLEGNFKNWIDKACTFHNTLVDRIVPGYPKHEIEYYNKQLNYSDKLIVTAETFFLWVIEGDERLKERLGFSKTGLEVKVVPDMQPFRTRKVRILNGAHTVMVPLSILYGNTTVKETMDVDFTSNFVKQTVFDEIINTLEMDKNELVSFANATFERFQNPYIVHNLSSIALNMISKFKVRVLPSLLSYFDKYGNIPTRLTFAFACLIRFYKGEYFGLSMPVNDDEHVTQKLSQIWQSNNNGKVAQEVLESELFWGQDLTKIEGLKDAIALALETIDGYGIEKGFESFNKSY
ncbi:tagaturonate reductase [Seonamhaeicola aphaedonensis]|uniref:Tagaturonate reductase n=1 Tax=Seonamhaeicola aphaedonensis TaxID=1461338 RepID=A0A3D9HDD2_9FLAO|nr:tagaturonate reductase [Seonamhaeicola aphaedonensis]RED47478.1 tagaturonate reductase [Seonamhaeicola aphaedonensis]